MNFRSPSSIARSQLEGVTLLELVIVMGVLAALAVIIVPLLSNIKVGREGEEKTPEQIATEQTLIHVRDAILGSSGGKGLWPDMGGRDAILFDAGSPEKRLGMIDLFEKRPEWDDYEPHTRLGWRGPYLFSGGLFGDKNDASYQPYGVTSDPAVLDAWGHPVVLQIPDAQYIRIVSGGPDGKIETPEGQDFPQLRDCGDDVVLYLRVADQRPQQ